MDRVPMIARSVQDTSGGRIGATIELPEIAGTGLMFVPETLGSQLAAAVGVGAFELGDTRFDAAVRTTAADAASARAQLDAPTRAAVAAAVEVGGRFTADRWQLQWVAKRHEGEGLGRALSALAAAHQAMVARSANEDLRGRLEWIAQNDRPPPVRLGAFQERLRLGNVGDRFLEACQRDLDPALRLAAATARGEAGRPGLLRMLKEGSRTWRVRAACSLARSGPGLPADTQDLVETTLIAALDDPELAGAAAEELGRTGRRRVLRALAVASRATELPRTARTAIRAALEAVRARVPADAVGGLALANDLPGGALALADSQADDRTGPGSSARADPGPDHW